MNLARIKLMALMLHALCVVQTVSLHKLASAMPNSRDKDTNLRRILKAMRQIIGSIRKLEAMMSMLQGFDSSSVKHKGIIVSRDPSTAQISAWKNLTDPKTRLLTHLARKRPKTLRRTELEAMYQPLQFRDIEFQHISVAPASKEAMADALTLKSSWQS